jgi:hypothetical protein
MTNKMYNSYRDPPHTPSPFSRKAWREFEPIAKVSRSAALRRLQKGWTILEAVTTPPVTQDQTDNIIAFLKKTQMESRETIAKAINKSSSTTLKFLESLVAEGKIFRSVGKTIKNRPIYFYSLTDNLTPAPPKEWDIDEEKNWKPKPYVNPIRQRALDDLEKLKKIKQK